MCTVASAPAAFRVRVWQIMSRGQGLGARRSPPRVLVLAILVTISPASISLFGLMSASLAWPEIPTARGRKSRPPRRRRRPLSRVRPARARQLYTPHRPRRIERPLEPDEGRDLVYKDPGLGVRGHAPEQRGEELEPASEPRLEHVMDRALREVADQHVVLARRDQLHSDQARSGSQRRHVD